MALVGSCSSITNAVSFVLRPGDMAQGFQVPPEQSIAITFHVVVPLPFWEWEDSISSMHIRFGDDRLGNWKDCGEFTKYRYLPFYHIYYRCLHCTHIC